MSSTIQRSHWYDVEQTAALLALHPETIREMIRDGAITATYLGRGRLGGFRIAHDEVVRIARERYPHMRLVFADDEKGGE